VFGSETAARNDKSDEAVGQGDGYARADGRSMSRAYRVGLRRRQVGTCIAGMRHDWVRRRLNENFD
jgi:hypothetical protein